ncbi:MAG: pyrroline-5-carboxylate reductase [Desulfovibrionaceae bacterium]
MAVRVGFIGTGAMGSAIIRGLVGREDLEVHGFDPFTPKLEELAADVGLKPHGSEEELAAACDVVVLAVKPQQMGPVTEVAAKAAPAGACLVSIAAGVTTDKLRQWSKSRLALVRVMPNTPALVRKGVFAVCLDDPGLSQSQAATVKGLFEPLGQVHVLAEKEFDAFTATIGSGPAYVLYFMEALVEAGLNLGLPRDQATQMVLGLFEGTSAMAVDSDKHISVLREMVTSPGGTTVRGLAQLDRGAVRATIMDAVEEAYDRSVELGE